MDSGRRESVPMIGLTGDRAAVFAVVPSAGRSCLTDCLQSLLPQVDQIFLVKTAPFSLPVEDHHRISTITVPSDEPKNISKWWNLGLDAAEIYARGYLGYIGVEWSVIVANDDIIAPPHLARTLDTEMRTTTAVLAYPNAFDDRRVMNTEPGPVDIHTRITGWCFMIKGESGLRADEDLVWWYGDDMIDWQARERGGALCVPGCAVVHLYPGQLTSQSVELTAQTQQDRETFTRKWAGKVPH